jgi:hypothetical protein
MTLSFTSHFRFGIPDFTQEPWHEDVEDTIRAIDTALYQTLLTNSTGDWANSTVYAVGMIVIDPNTGMFWTCATAHTSATSPTTFATDRTNHPTYWNATVTIPQFRGTWVTGTSYTANDFVVDSGRYGVCIVSHVSGASFSADLAGGKWVVLIDTSNVGAGINNQAEDTLAGAATTNLGSKTSTRLLISGAGATITSFGNVANTFKILRYAGVNTITYNATSLILFGASNRTTAAGDIQWLASDSTGNWRELMYNKGDGSPVSIPVADTTTQGKVELATDAETLLAETSPGTADATRAVTPHSLGAALTQVTTDILATIRNGVGASLDTLAEIATALNTLAPKAAPTFTGTASFADISYTGTLSASGTTPTAPRTVQRLTSGSGTYTPGAGTKWVRVRMCAGGGGGGAQSTNSGTNGGDTSFGAWTAIHGIAGVAGAGGGTGGTGGANGTGTLIHRVDGGSGGVGGFDSTAGTRPAGGMGGNNPFGGAGGQTNNAAGYNAGANTGGGGGGAGANINTSNGGGGGAGEYVEFFVTNPVAVSYAVGAGGAGGAAGGKAGGNGGSGVIIIEEYYI